MEKIYAVLFKADDVMGDNFLIGLTKDMRNNGVFMIYQTTARPPTRLKIVHEENDSIKTIGDSPIRTNGQAGSGR